MAPGGRTGPGALLSGSEVDCSHRTGRGDKLLDPYSTQFTSGGKGHYDHFYFSLFCHTLLFSFYSELC